MCTKIMRREICFPFGDLALLNSKDRSQSVSVSSSREENKRSWGDWLRSIPFPRLLLFFLFTSFPLLVLRCSSFCTKDDATNESLTWKSCHEEGKKCEGERHTEKTAKTRDHTKRSSEKRENQILFLPLLLFLSFFPILLHMHSFDSRLPLVLGNSCSKKSKVSCLDFPSSPVYLLCLPPSSHDIKESLRVPLPLILSPCFLLFDCILQGFMRSRSRWNREEEKHHDTKWSNSGCLSRQLYCLCNSLWL